MNPVKPICALAWFLPDLYVAHRHTQSDRKQSTILLGINLQALVFRRMTNQYRIISGWGITIATYLVCCDNIPLRGPVAAGLYGYSAGAIVGGLAYLNPLYILSGLYTWKFAIATMGS